MVQSWLKARKARYLNKNIDDVLVLHLGDSEHLDVEGRNLDLCFSGPQTACKRQKKDVRPLHLGREDCLEMSQNTLQNVANLVTKSLCKQCWFPCRLKQISTEEVNDLVKSHVSAERVAGVEIGVARERQQTCVRLGVWPALFPGMKQKEELLQFRATQIKCLRDDRVACGMSQMPNESSSSPPACSCTNMPWTRKCNRQRFKHFPNWDLIYKGTCNLAFVTFSRLRCTLCSTL